MSDFTPRPYQIELMKIALKKNTVIYLPTGSGKTYIALMVLKEMCAPLLKKYSEGGKITIILVNSVVLVNQHAKYVANHTTFKVGQYTGEMNLDFWPRDRWYEEYDKYQVLIMTSQILLNIINQFFIDLNKINLLIFDECHHAVNDHPMRGIMKGFNRLTDPPRVLGLTATLLNRNIDAFKVLQEVKTLETTFHGQVAAPDCLNDVLGYSTNPQEKFIIYNNHNLKPIEMLVISLISKLKLIVKAFKIEGRNYTMPNLMPLNDSCNLKDLNNLLEDIILHMSTMGIYGAIKCAISYMIQLECLKKHCQDLKMFALFTCIITKLSFIKQTLSNEIKEFEEKDQIDRFSSDKILHLIDIFRNYSSVCKEELCVIIFTKRRFTAKLIYHILDSLSKCNPEFQHIKPDYIVGFNNNPYNSTRESLFISKKNKQVIEMFRNKEINVLVSSSVLEEGVDMQKCCMVIRYDLPEDYRGYIQSKGRARNKDSLFYMMVEQTQLHKYNQRYCVFQNVEKALNDYLVGSNFLRQEPTQHDIQKMYEEDVLPPYYVAGKDSAFVDMGSAIALLSQYCASLPSDTYTTYTPEWYVTKMSRGCSVTILLPVISPLRDLIEGQCMHNLKNAKRVAALEACKRLHIMGELDDHLLPKKHNVLHENVDFLFTHVPKEKDPKAGTVSKRRHHPMQISQYLLGSIKPQNTYYLQIISLNPVFKRPTNLDDGTLYDIYTSITCYGVLTPKAIPVICDFPIHVTLGEICVSVKINQEKYLLSDEDLRLIKHFHFTVFDGILNVLQRFLMFDDSNKAQVLLVVPVNKVTGSVDFDILRKEFKVKAIVELTSDEKQTLTVTKDSYLKSIVTPWYRDSVAYVVTEVCLNQNALSPFPNECHTNYKSYFYDKHSKFIFRPDLPLLLVKGLTKRLNFIKPRGRELKRKHDQMYEEKTEHLLPELVVQQDFPSDLWIQANFLPTILNRISYILKFEDLRRRICADTGLGKIDRNQPPLSIDEYILKNECTTEEPQLVDFPTNFKDLKIQPVSLQINKDFSAKVLEAEFPWKDIEEPKNILKALDVTLMEVEHYQMFISQSVHKEENFTLKNQILNKPLAIGYPSNFIPMRISLLENRVVNVGPTLSNLYSALTCSKSDDIVNLERLETLGDSFLKLISSVYITLRFPNFNEGHATTLKGRMVSNKNLFYLASQKNLCGVMKFAKLSPKEEWLPPAFKVPDKLSERILKKELSISTLYNFYLSEEEQLTGALMSETIEQIREEDQKPDETEDACYNNLASFLGCQYIGDKHVADVVESLLGCYFETCGFEGAIKFVEWVGIIPKSEKIEELLKNPSPNPLLNKNATTAQIQYHMPQWREIEAILGYTFKNHAYLLQALTHASFSPNRLTQSYEKLEFLGDAILDFLITCYIYEHCGKLDPGDLTDLRSALVNNNTFASLVVRTNLHKFLLMVNSTLQKHIDKFVEFFRGKHYKIDDEILILLSEDELYLAEFVDVPKVLGDIFEALAGAIYLDSGRDLKRVWDVFYKLMWKEIELFSKTIPKNSVRVLYEKPGLYPRFGLSQKAANEKTLVPLQFQMDGITKTVYGCGNNVAMAKKAAAKLALRCLKL